MMRNQGEEGNSSMRRGRPKGLSDTREPRLMAELELFVMAAEDVIRRFMPIERMPMEENNAWAALCHRYVRSRSLLDAVRGGLSEIEWDGTKMIRELLAQRPERAETSALMLAAEGTRADE